MNPESRAKSIQLHNDALPVVATDRVKAYRLLCSATIVDPTMAVAWDTMGNSLTDIQDPTGKTCTKAAIAAYRRCLELPIGETNGDLTPYVRAKAMVNLAHRLVNEGQLDEAISLSRTAINLLEADPSLDTDGYAMAWANMSLALSFQGEHDGAVRYARTAYEKSQEPMIETALAFALLFAGQYAEGLKRFEARIAYRLPQFLNMPYDRWIGGSAGTLLVESDMGIGDTLSMARFVPQASKLVKKLVFRVQSDIRKMMELAFIGLKNVEVIPQSPTFPFADCWIPVMSLPAALGLSDEQIRTHRQIWEMPPARCEVPQGWKAPGRKLHVAIAYAGNPGNDIDQHRSIPVTEFLDLYKVPGIQLYSVQIGDRVRELHDHGCSSLIRDLSPYLKDALDTVAILRECDLVVACESFVAHLAAAADIPCWVPLWVYGGDWRCGRSGDHPLWYPKTRLFRQERGGDWSGPFAAIVEALRDRLRQ